MGRVLINGPRFRGSIPRRVITKTEKRIHDASLLDIIEYGSRVTGPIQGNE